MYGVYKRSRNFAKMIAKSSFLDNSMTLSVFINTISLALDRYGIDKDLNILLGTFNTIFTWIFIFEMGIKLIGQGLAKYVAERMNLLDGTVVILSIVEMAFSDGDGGSMNAFKTIRIFRTFRVLRVARLLRAMKSMQVIIGVLMKSMSSFIYLALLLLLFIFIYSLLGMQIFGGNFKFEVDNFD
jgi:hypothetical protein